MKISLKRCKGHRTILTKTKRIMSAFENIPRNDYVQQKVVRIGVVTKIIGVVLKTLSSGDDFRISLEGVHPKMYLSVGIDGKYYQGKCYLSYEPQAEKYWTNEQIRTSEMRTVFKVLQDKGYFIYRYCDFEYYISKNPYRCSVKAERVEFTQYID